ncbi:hypothetical protein [Treponema brennaborense]|uniref:Uncharacterized protein n=1 Tax=Treponema brennaborense (strain DSM 12168 / CIP 105900 / DD5/3) TaxID=906968 RepID=F4LNR3_TREBD|nr:hypothetical protein [Treponema brennaborense]AEE16898.1 hypothetical protein Trebr_1474 [Treponema brennaborense DSM 12168]
MDKRLKECSEKLRRLVSDVQGAPYPGSLESELYTIWYEHIQQIAVECFEFLDENFPKEQEDISKSINKIF